MKVKISYACFLLLSIIFCSFDARAQMVFDRPKSEPKLDNPYVLNIPREQIMDTVREVLKTCSIKIDDAQSNSSEGKIVTNSVIFSRGVTTKTDLDHLAKMPAGDVHNWQQGRWSLEIVALPLDEQRSKLSINAHIEGKVFDPSGVPKWIEGQSSGLLEDEALRGLVGRILGIDLSLKVSSGRSTRRIMGCEY